jgi:hypothetical protein
MQKELSNFGDHAVATLQANASIPEGMGVDGYYKVECRDAHGNLKWNEAFPNLVVAVGKQLCWIPCYVLLVLTQLLAHS